MTDLQQTKPAAEPDGGPVYTLPELPTLDPRSAIAVAINDELDRQLAGQDVALAINPGPIADAVLAAFGDERSWPRIPEWTGDSRSIGGGRPAGSAHPDPLITVEPEVDDRGTPRTGYVRLHVEGEDTHPDETTAIVSADAVVPVEDAEAWFLAGLAACRAAGRVPGHPDRE